MDFIEVIARRHMVRAFDTRAIDEPVLARILDAGRRTGSAGNTHGTTVLVLDSAAHRDLFWECTGNVSREPTFPWPELSNAPVILLPLAHASEYRKRYAEPDKASHVPDADLWRIPFWYVDSGFAIQNMLLAATNEGIGALFFGVYGEHVRALMETFCVGTDAEILGAIALGHPAESVRPSRSAARGRPSLETFAIRPEFSGRAQT